MEVSRIVSIILGVILGNLFGEWLGGLIGKCLVKRTPCEEEGEKRENSADATAGSSQKGLTADGEPEGQKEAEGQQANKEAEIDGFAGPIYRWGLVWPGCFASLFPNRGDHSKDRR